MKLVSITTITNMKMSEILLLKSSSLFILLLISLQTSDALNSHICSSSSCGIIPNISFPFRFKHHPKHCGYPDYELACENNVTLLYLSSQKYKVKAINYHNFTIGLVDVSVNNTNTFSFPNSSPYPYNFNHGYPYSTGLMKRSYIRDFPEIAVPINFMSCPQPLNNSSLYTDANDCAHRDRVLDASSRHTYIKVGHMNASGVRDMCRIDMIVMTSWKFEDLKNVSISEIYQSLLYGFELSWLLYPCSKCRDRSSCSLDEDHAIDCEFDVPHAKQVSFPFRFKHHPKHCGYPDYELACENNVTLLYLSSQKYKVKAINYHNFTIKLVDVSVNNTNTFSFPNSSAYQYNFTYGYPYSTGLWKRRYVGYIQEFPEIAVPINFMSCPHPLNYSSLFTDANDCANRDRVLDASSRHTYIKVGHMNASDVRDMCRIDMIVMTSWKFEDLKNVSISEIHESLLYGFELSWLRYPCSKCRDTNHCFLDEDHTVDCGLDLEVPGLLCLLIIVIVVIFTGVSIPAKIILGITCLHGLPLLDQYDWSFRSFFDLYKLAINLAGLGMYIGTALAGRLIIGFICLMGFLIYKFRRRHLSMFDAIESFLRSDNKLVPIRYSYSNINKMTRGFREELGQGGYGKVYKGKLRSGRDVAVKLLGKAGANGKDFMNEIATIGRIHHVNVINLVGYCAERSKRVLVYDFMPNGSLDKYIYKEDGVNSLDWQTKYEIAIGVARGIEYLHRGCDIQILHFDIKPHNILLDDKFIPKISDFGLAKFYSTEKKTVTLTAARGTIGYVAPELINKGFGRVSYKADVYSFGMLLIEMVCLKKDLMGNDEESSQYFPDWIYERFDHGSDVEIGEIDEINEDGDNDDTRRITRKMTIVALWCIQMRPDDRPSMNKVLEMLEGEVERLQIPQRPTQSTQVVLDEDQSWSTYSTDYASLLCHDAAPSFEIRVLDS
ncbi:hypothetical protein ACS0TY_000057 [Phlomoides rotata]